MSRNRPFRCFVSSTGWGLSRPVCRGGDSHRIASGGCLQRTGLQARRTSTSQHGGRSTEAFRNTVFHGVRISDDRLSCLVVSRCSVFPVGGTDRSAISKERYLIHIRSTGTAPSAAEHPARSRNASAASYLEPCVRPCGRKRAFDRFLRHETGVPNLPSHRRFQVAR